MSRHVNIAAVGLAPLQVLGIRSLLQSRDDVVLLGVSNFQELKTAPESIDAFIVSAEQLVGKLDFFMTRKERTAVMFDHPVELPSPLLSVWSGAEEGILADLLARLLSACRSSACSDSLSRRELDVLRLLAKGKTNKEIADMLCISVNTATTHRKNISAKLGIRSVSGLSLYALMNGII